MLLKEVADIIFSFPQKDDSFAVKPCLWLSSGCLLADNKILEFKEEASFVPYDNLKILKNDIIIRRVQPQFVNFISEDNNYMLGQNLAIIRAKEGVNGKYLAFILECNLDKLYKDMSGAVLPAVKRKNFEELDIGDLPENNKQLAIGEVWWLMKEKRKLTQNLLEQEKILLEARLRSIQNLEVKKK